LGGFSDFFGYLFAMAVLVFKKMGVVDTKTPSHGYAPVCEISSLEKTTILKHLLKIQILKRKIWPLLRDIGEK